MQLNTVVPNPGDHFYQDSMVAPLNNFLKNDMEELSSLQGMTKLSEDEMEDALCKHSKLSKRDSEKKKLETNQEVNPNLSEINLICRQFLKLYFIFYVILRSFICGISITKQ